jgi:outer membrane protein OmpA-like peptidoglycan-associated protein
MRTLLSCRINQLQDLDITKECRGEQYMASQLMDSILGMVTPEIKQSLAARLGDSPQAVQSGLTTATAATLGGLASRAGDSGFLSQIMGLLGGGNTQNILGSLSSIASGGPTGGVGDLVNKFLPMIFGSNQGQIASAISQQAGLGAGSGLGILKMAAPLVLGYLGKLHSAGSLNASSLGNMLKAEAPNLQSYLPGGLGNLVSNAGATATHAVSAVGSGAAAAASSSSRWLVPLAIIAALILAWILFRSMGGPKEAVQSATNATNTAATAVGNAANSAWAALGEMVQVKLPDGTVLNAPALGVEARLVKYLNDPTAQVSEDTWFDFDRLLFDTGKSTLQPASQEQLNNIALIMKAYPGVKIRIGGYTDNTGDADANVKLSQDRADNVASALTTLGVDGARMDAKGYGAANPIADNSTEEGRQKNRRISLRVTEKPAPPNS